MQAIIEAAKAKAAANTPQNFSTSTGAPDQKPATPKAPPVIVTAPDKIVSGKIYNLLGANGATMQEIKRVKLPAHCQIFLESSSSEAAATIMPEDVFGKQKAIVLSERNPRYIYLDVKYMQPYSKKFGIGSYYSDSFKTFSTEIVKKYCTLADQALNPAPTAAPQSIDDILNNAINTQEEETPPPAPAKPSIYIEMPKSAPAADPVTIAPPAAPQQLTNGTYTMHHYFTVTGRLPNDTIKIKAELRRMGGVYVPGADCGSCWLFPMKKMLQVKRFLNIVS